MTRTHLGSTDAAPVLASLGLCSSPWRSAYDVWTGLRGHAQPTSPAMLRGTSCEPHLARRVAQLAGCALQPVAPVVAPHGHTHLRISGDYACGRTGYELKTSGAYAHSRWSTLPDYYRVQATLEAWAFGWGEVIVPVLVIPACFGAVETLTLAMSPEERAAAIEALAPVMVAASEIQVYRVERDDEWAESIARVMRRWWDRYHVGGEAPTPEATDAFAHFARVEMPSREPLRPAVDGEADLALAYDAARAAEKRARLEKDSIGAHLRAAIGTAEGFKVPGLGYAVARPRTPRTDWKAVASEMGVMLGLRGEDPRAVIARHTTPDEGRTLDVEIEAAVSGECGVGRTGEGYGL